MVWASDKEASLFIGFLSRTNWLETQIASHLGWPRNVLGSQGGKDVWTALLSLLPLLHGLG